MTQLSNVSRDTERRTIPPLPNEWKLALDASRRGATLPTSRRRHPLRADVVETPHSVIVTVDLPGHDPSSIDVQLHRGTLRIRSTRRWRSIVSGRLHRTERRYGTFEGVVEIPACVDSSSLSTHRADGVLTITLAKEGAEAA